MLNPQMIKTVSDLRANPLSVLKTAKKAGEPVYIFYRTRPQAAIIDIEDLNNLIEEIEDLKDAAEVAERKKEKTRKLIAWEKVKKELNL